MMTRARLITEHDVDRGYRLGALARLCQCAAGELRDHLSGTSEVELAGALSQSLEMLADMCSENVDALERAMPDGRAAPESGAEASEAA